MYCAIITLEFGLCIRQYYRARYDSEGVRAPLKGVKDSYPAVQVSTVVSTKSTLVSTQVIN